MFEHRHEELLSRREFVRRMGRFALLGVLLIAISWLIGILGYHMLENMSWLDSVLNAAMILGGMGPVDQLHTTAGKLFASFYAIFSGVVFLASVAVLFAPVLHRVMHKFHLQVDKD
ncbi:MAG: hypothetical protein JWO50_493 [Candidatus Kaiserbacteria bacterium]|nr:hypothetical protein [Candidatus Kaiserbacteria bacterium]